MDIDENTNNWKDRLKEKVEEKMQGFKPESPYLNPKTEIKQKKKKRKLTLRLKPSIASLNNPLDGISEIQRFESNINEESPTMTAK